MSYLPLAGTPFTATGASTARTLASRFTDWVSVLDYGADPTGTSDSTSAFAAALAKGPVLVPALQPNGSKATYLINNLVIPSASAMVGVSSAGYTGQSGTVVKPTLLNTAGSARVLNVDGTHGFLLEGIQIAGWNTSLTTDGISGGSQCLTLSHVDIVGCNHGIGGAVTGSVQQFPTASWVFNATNCVFDQNLIGMGELIDGHITGCWFTGCGNGAKLDGNSSTNTFVGCRFEWNGRIARQPSAGGGAGYGMYLNGSSENQITGCMFDNNGEAGIYFKSAFITMVTGCYFRRNGNNVSSGTTLIANSCHLLFDGTYNCQITGCSTRAMNDDGGVYGPAAIAHFIGTAGSNGEISFVNNDLTGYQGSTAGASSTSPTNSNTLWRTGTPPTATGGLNGFIVKQNWGTGTAAQDVDTR